MVKRFMNLLVLVYAMQSGITVADGTANNGLHAQAALSAASKPVMSTVGDTPLAPVEQQEQQMREPYVIVEQVLERVLAQLEAAKALRKNETAEVKTVHNLVDSEVGPIVDFDLIAKRVMASHYKYANPEQRERFAKVFKHSLVGTYALVLASYSDQKVVLLPFKGVNAKGKRERAKVDMEIRSDEGKVYPMTYAMYKTQEGAWKLENLVVNGINLGLTFRNQFKESLRAHKGDIDKVIEEWNSKAIDL